MRKEGKKKNIFLNEQINNKCLAKKKLFITNAYYLLNTVKPVNTERVYNVNLTLLWLLNINR